LSNACPSGPAKPSLVAREGQASNKARPLLPFATSIVERQLSEYGGLRLMVMLYLFAID